MYVVLVQFDVRPECREDFRALARRHAEDSLREEPGTLQFHIVQDETNPDRFYAVEGYADNAAHEAHRRGPILARNGPLVGPMLAGSPVPLGRGPSADGLKAP
jgi:autoinducer 2-degrading protein